MRAAPYCPGNTPPWYGRFTPAESTRYTIGMRCRIAISCARSIFLIVSGHQEPAFTVASFATTTTGRPAIRPSRDHAGTGRLPIVLIGGHEQADFEPGRDRIEEGGDSLARRQLPLLVLAAHAVGPAALLEPALELAVFRCERFEAAQRRLRRDMLGRPLFDVLHQVRGRGTGAEQPPDSVLA